MPLTNRILFAAYDKDLFDPPPAWRRVEEIIDQDRGGNFGVTGPRGAGKTWLMKQAVSRAWERGGLGFWFPSPSEYDARAFLASLSEVFATTFVDHYLRENKYATEDELWNRLRQARLILVTAVVVSAVLLVWGVADGFGSTSRLGGFLNTQMVLGLAILMIAPVVYVFARGPLRERDAQEKLYLRALDLRRQARFSAAYTDVVESSAGAAGSGLSALVRKSAETALSERPATISSMIHDFRRFAQDVAASRQPVVIAIDELDKMSSASEVAALLRDIKGIFDIAHVHFFVSISDEAARSLDLGSVQQRNEFNSSFYQVIDLAPGTPESAARLFERRGWDVGGEAAAKLSILSGGNPRELLRLMDAVLSGSPDQSLTHIELLVLKGELAALQREIENTQPTVIEQAKEQVLSRLTNEDRLRGARLLERLHREGLADGAPDHHLTDPYWIPEDTSTLWRERFEEPWRRLMVRLTVGQRLAQPSWDPSDDVAAFLQEVVLRNSGSADIGRALLRGELAPQTRLPEGIPAPEGAAPFVVTPVLRSAPSGQRGRRGPLRRGRVVHASNFRKQRAARRRARGLAAAQPRRGIVRPT